MSGGRVAIIGAGAAGMAQMRAFQSAKLNGASVPQIVCFEKQSDWGGLWNYTWRTGLDEYGEPVHGSMYRYLWSNAPKECLEFSDYTFNDHFGKGIGSFPPRAVLWDYVKGRVEKADVRKWVRFSSPVRMVTHDVKTDKFSVMVHDHIADRVYVEQFDYVVVATGHFSVPHVPEFEGFDKFNGRVLHSHDFRDALEFKGQKILIIGRSYSAEDIASQCYKYGAKSITISYRSQPIGYDWPNNIQEVPLLQRIENQVCYFKDGSQKENIDAIILCTGYVHHYPFLPDHLRLITSNRYWPTGLYKGVVWQRNPRLFYLGAQEQYFTFNMFDVQAWFVRDVILGVKSIPTSIESMEEDDEPWRVRELQLETDEEGLYYQGDYVKMMMEETDYPKFDVDAVVETFMEWKENKKKNIMGYRDYMHRSVMTGSMATLHHTPWLDALDDSFECYLGL